MCPFGAAGRRSAAVQPDPADAGGLGALDVALEAVADHHGPVGVHSEELERVGEDLPSGLPRAQVPRDHDSVEASLGEPASGQLLALEARGAVGDERQRVRGPQRLERGPSVRERLVPEPALDTEPLAEQLGQGRVDDVVVGERHAPRVRAVARGPLPACSHLGALALPATPQRLPGAHPDRVLPVGVRRPGAPQLAGPGTRRAREDGRVDRIPAGCHVRRRQKRGRRGRLLDDQRVVEVEEDRLRHAGHPVGPDPRPGVWPRWFT